MTKPDSEYLANANIHDKISHFDWKKETFSQVEHHVREILRALMIDTETDPNTIDTPKRVAKMYIEEVFAGRYQERPRIATFPNTRNVDELFTIGPISVRSACSHHLVPVIGKVWIGVIPNQKLLGLSKFARLTEWVMARPHIQEEATEMLADEIENIINPKGLAVVMQAKHFCMCWRGVKEQDSLMTSSVVRGLLKGGEARQEFFNLIKER